MRAVFLILLPKSRLFPEFSTSSGIPGGFYRGYSSLFSSCHQALEVLADPESNPDTFALRPGRVHISIIPWDRTWNSQAVLSCVIAATTGGSTLVHDLPACRRGTKNRLQYSARNAITGSGWMHGMHVEILCKKLFSDKILPPLHANEASVGDGALCYSPGLLTGNTSSSRRGCPRDGTKAQKERQNF